MQSEGDFVIFQFVKLQRDNNFSYKQSDNPIMNVDGEESAIERTIFSLANQYQRNVNDDNEMILKTKYYIGGVPFHFQWKLTKANGDVVRNSRCEAELIET